MSSSIRKNCLIREQSPPSSWSKLYSPRHPVPSQTTRRKLFLILESVSICSFRFFYKMCITYTAREQIVLVPVLGRCTDANALPCDSVSVTCVGRYPALALTTLLMYPYHPSSVPPGLPYVSSLVPIHLSSSLNTWTVSVLEEQAKNVPQGENDREKMEAVLLIPLLSSYSLDPSLVSNTLMTVP